jgi:hypothetical protein
VSILILRSGFYRGIELRMRLAVRSAIYFAARTSPLAALRSVPSPMHSKYVRPASLRGLTLSRSSSIAVVILVFRGRPLGLPLTPLGQGLRFCGLAISFPHCSCAVASKGTISERLEKTGSWPRREGAKGPRPSASGLLILRNEANKYCVFKTRLSARSLESVSPYAQNSHLFIGTLLASVFARNLCGTGNTVHGFMREKTIPTAGRQSCS